MSFYVDFFREDQPPPVGLASDGIGPFPTHRTAFAAGCAEVARVAAIPPDTRDPTMDWAAWFTVRAFGARTRPSRADPPEAGANPWPTMYGEFRDFDQSTLPPIPAGWTDERSWRNDACPSFETPEHCVVYVDYADPADREHGAGPRYSVRVMEERANGEFEMIGTNTFPDLDSDDWAEVLAHVAKVPMMRKARKAVAAFEALRHAIAGLVTVYEADDTLNDIQPDDHVAAVCPMSFDEWHCEAHALVEAWEAIAVGDEPKPAQSPRVGVIR